MNKFFGLLTVALVTFSCSLPLADFQQIPTETESALAPEARSLTSPISPVVLYKETSLSFYVYHGISGESRTYQILVADLAFDKQVNIRFAMADGTWKDYPATFIADVDGNQELWEVTTSGYLGWGYVAFSEFAGPFAVNYIVNGKTYWDNNQGKNYQDIGNYLAPQQQITLQNLSYYGGFTGKLLVRNLAFKKSVNVVYTSDSWATTLTAPGIFESAIPGTDLEVWTFYAPLPAYNTPAIYAFSYDVNGKTYWDNNHGRNYNYAP